MTQKKKIIIIALIGAFLVLPLLLALTYVTVIKPNEPTIKTSIDPITGEQIIDGDTTPEKTLPGGGTVSGPTIYGADNVADLYGNNDVFYAISDHFFQRVFKDDKAVKISPKNIEKKSINNPDTGEGYIAVTFYIYLNNDTVNKYTMETKYDQNSGLVDITLTSPKGDKQTDQININGGD